MSLLHESIDQKRFDIRLLEKNLARGVVKQAEVDKQLKALPDDAANASYTNMDELALEQTGPAPRSS